MGLGWFSGLFLFAAIIAVATGEAYFRGAVRRDDNPRDFWVTVACYLALALLAPAIAVLQKLGVGR